MSEKALRVLEGLEEELIEFIRQLIRIPSHKDVPGQEREIAMYIKKKLEKENIEVFLQKVIDDRYNVIAKVRGEFGGRSLMLNGHLDTVPPYTMVNPFSADIKEGKIYGRGSVDMKASLGCMAYTLIAIKRAGIRLKSDLYFTGVVGEEFQSPGATFLATHGPRADMAIVGEATNLAIAPAMKGVMWIRFLIRGISAHGCEPEKGVNAILKAVEVINFMVNTLTPLYQKKVHPLCGCPTINIGTIKGGTQPNIVPNECAFTIDRRLIPGEDHEKVLKEMQEMLVKLKEKDPELIVEMEHLPETASPPRLPMEVPTNHSLVLALQKACKQIIGRSKIIGVSYFCDAGYFTNAGTPTVIFGPGDIALAHSDKESIEIEQVIDAAKIYLATALDICEAF
jgi:acetylornithine deacetylase/succinyl-diaminopimelate desuccinylase